MKKHTVAHVIVKASPVITEKTFVAIADYNTDEWTEIAEDSIYQLDIRYATEDNFMKQVIYDCGRCFLRPKVMELLQNAAEELQEKGYGVVVYDCYRPRPYQQKLWDIMPNAMYVTPPEKGSMHNRGHAIDMSLFDLRTGELIDMGTDYDFFGPEAHYNFPNASKEVKRNRYILRSTMEKHGFSGIRTEWWHFGYKQELKPFSDWLWSC